MLERGGIKRPPETWRDGSEDIPDLRALGLR